MDRSRFVEIAPYYYALAIGHTLSKASYPVLIEQIVRDHFVHDDQSSDPDDGFNYLERGALVDRAVALLEQLGLAVATAADFGPALREASPDFRAIWDALAEDSSKPFFHFRKSGNNLRWLYGALIDVNRQYSELAIQASDFAAPNREWEPIPLDRSDPKLQKVTETLEEAIEQVRADNGYSATMPEEKAYVLDGLQGTLQKLKTDEQISLGYIRRYALEPLATLARRFKDAAIGLVTEAARAALLEWLKANGPKWIIALLRNLF